MSSPAAIDIAIVNYHSAADTLAAIAGLAPWRFGTLWLVDNSEDAREAETLRKQTATLPWVRLLVAERNLGFGLACNRAYAQSDSPFFLLLNPDARIVPDSIEQLAQALESDRRWGAVSPRIYWDPQHRFLLPTAFPQTPLTELRMSLLRCSATATRLAFKRYLATQQARMAANDPFATGFVAGAVLMVRRAAVQTAGGLFDPDYFMFYEDSDLSVRLRRKGYRLGIVPQAAAVHGYRHKASKEPLMAASHSIYLRKRFPLLSRPTRGLRWLDALTARSALWSEITAQPLWDVDQLNALLGNAGVVALSPSPLMMPAIFRPAGADPVTLNSQEWTLLEPGLHWVALQPQSRSAALRITGFRRIARPAV